MAVQSTEHSTALVSWCLRQRGGPPQWPTLSSLPPFTPTFSQQFVSPAKFLHILTFLPKVTLTAFYSPSPNFCFFCAGKMYKYLGHYCCSSDMAHHQNTSSTGGCTGDCTSLYEILVYEYQFKSFFHLSCFDLLLQFICTQIFIFT